MMNRLYVLARQDLNYSSPHVQAGHCVAEFCLNSDGDLWNNHTLIYLGVKDLKELERWCFKLEQKNIKYTGFREPDMNDELTSIATLLENGKIFKNLKLL